MRTQESQISNLKSQISNLKSQISNLKSQISNLKSQISNLKSQISNLKSQISRRSCRGKRGGVLRSRRGSVYTAWPFSGSLFLCVVGLPHAFPKRLYRSHRCLFARGGLE
ncbi:FlxA-like family protein [Roseimaritima ulvae]|uniref:FlxA-like family protein n=1 Tax=Roseimaritima ulvae TaxID=980254 RepID=UPI0036F3DF86